MLPALRPAAAVLGLLHVHAALERLPVAVPRRSTPTTPPSRSRCRRLSSGYYTDQSLVMAGTLMATLPLLVVLFVFGRQIIGGIMEGAVKG